ncbi:MAG: NTP transferase domain-containing protein [Candidatus Helarchaeota archaeon]
MSSNFSRFGQQEESISDYNSDNLNLLEEPLQDYVNENLQAIEAEDYYKEQVPPKKCLIIAAGRGSRLSDRCESKPLLPLLGLRLIERVILTAKKAGLEEFYIVTGYNGKELRRFLDELSRKRNITIKYIFNDEWRRGNGISVLKARDYIDDDFVLLMCDHIFDENILIELIDEPHSPDEIIMALDYNIMTNNLIDIDDVTKVFVKNKRVKDIGKEIYRYNAFDTGIFLCSPILFNALEESIENGDESLSGGIRILAEYNRVKVFDIRDRYWIDVDDSKAYKKAKKLLLSKLKKKSDGPISRYLNRPVSMRITQKLVKYNITPNQISLLSFILAIIGSIFFLSGGYFNLVAGALLAQFASIIDGCDGEIARLKMMASDFGGWFDAVLDRYADAFLLFGLTYYIYTIFPGFLTLFIGFLAIIGSFMNSYTADKYDGLMKQKLGNKSAYFRLGRDVRIIILLIGILLNLGFLVLILIASIMNFENIRRVVVLYKNQ